MEAFPTSPSLIIHAKNAIFPFSGREQRLFSVSVPHCTVWYCSCPAGRQKCPNFMSIKAFQWPCTWDVSLKVNIYFTCLNSKEIFPILRKKQNISPLFIYLIVSSAWVISNNAECRRWKSGPKTSTGWLQCQKWKYVLFSGNLQYDPIEENISNF